MKTDHCLNDFLFMNPFLTLSVRGNLSLSFIPIAHCPNTHLMAFVTNYKKLPYLCYFLLVISTRKVEETSTMLGRKCSVAKTEHLWQIYFSELVSPIPITYPPAVSSENPLRLVLPSIKKKCYQNMFLVT